MEWFNITVKLIMVSINMTVPYPVLRVTDHFNISMNAQCQKKVFFRSFPYRTHLWVQFDLQNTFVGLICFTVYKCNVFFTSFYTTFFSAFYAGALLVLTWNVSLSGRPSLGISEERINHYSQCQLIFNHRCHPTQPLLFFFFSSDTEHIIHYY